MSEAPTKKQLASIEKKLDRLIGLRHVFVRGLVRGLGIAIGTTIIAAIVFAFFSAIARPIIGEERIENLSNRISG